MHVQGSREWLLSRMGFVTASRFGCVLTKPRSKEDRVNGGMSKTAQTYMRQLLAEHLTGEPTEEIKAKQLEWGKVWEPVARAAYAKYVQLPVEEVGFTKHKTEQLIGASPDAIVSGGIGSAEIKAPMTAQRHLEVVMWNALPEEHVEQVQGVIWVTGAQWCDFVSYHDRFPPHLRLKVIRVPRDDYWQRTIGPAVIAFRNELLRQLKQFLTDWKE